MARSSGEDSRGRRSTWSAAAGWNLPPAAAGPATLSRRCPAGARSPRRRSAACRNSSGGGHSGRGAVDLGAAAGIAATQPQEQPQQQTAATFTGRWNGEAQGSPYTFNLTQVGDNVSGAYVGGDGPNGSQGQITGTLAGNVLRFQWWQTDGLRGMGKFTLSADGSAFTGSYTLGSNPDVAEGSWNGWRQ